MKEGEPGFFVIVLPKNDNPVTYTLDNVQLTLNRGCVFIGYYRNNNGIVAQIDEIIPVEIESHLFRLNRSASFDRNSVDIYIIAKRNVEYDNPNKYEKYSTFYEEPLNPLFVK